MRNKIFSIIRTVYIGRLIYGIYSTNDDKEGNFPNPKMIVYVWIINDENRIVDISILILLGC